MDPLTHALASYTLKRAAFPRLSLPTTVAMLLAGTIADLDLLSAKFGPSTFLTFYRTYLHSFAAALLFGLLATLPFVRKRGPEEKQTSPFPIFIAAFSAAVLHLLLDLCQSTGVELLWPFSARRFALDWLPPLDLWIMGILLAGILLPMLSRLVTEEIGAKSKGPRGKVGASLSLAAVILYVVLRFVLHGNAIAALESRTYRGESSGRVAAIAESGSPFLWHGIVETERALHDIEIDVGPGASFDPDAGITSYKPEPSPALDASRDTPVARQFLRVARFPKATVEKSPDGFHILLRAFPYNRDASSGLRVHAEIHTDPSGKVLSEELAWDPGPREFWWH
ncbi:MAG TPA: metal-dependent hydrolase [Candidatus Acidoferrum sp.]|nr:metal-dependent hydrolase [Candidatus Acidoferrum sp.]